MENTFSIVDKPLQTPDQRFWKNLRDLPSAITFPSILSGLVVTIMGYTSPLILVIQAANAANMPAPLVSSWVWAVAIGTGIASISQSLLFRMPLLGAWPTAGAALLVTSLPHYPYPEVIGAFILAGLAFILLGMSGLFSRVTALVPTPVAMGMLAGILFRFGTGVFGAMSSNLPLVAAMITAYFVLQRVKYRTPALGALAAGVMVAVVQGNIHLQGFSPALAVPILTLPVFSVQTALSLALPLFVVVLVSQYVPGQAVMRACGYNPPVDKILVISGVLSTVFAFFGSHGMVMAAITAGITGSPEAHPDPTKRYSASVANGFWYIAAGTFGATAIALFAGLPAALIAAISGLALTPTLVTSVSGAMSDLKGREAGLVALLCTASNVELFGIGSSFWGLVVGMAVYVVLNQKPRVDQARSSA